MQHIMELAAWLQDISLRHTPRKARGIPLFGGGIGVSPSLNLTKSRGKILIFSSLYYLPFSLDSSCRGDGTLMHAGASRIHPLLPTFCLLPASCPPTSWPRSSSVPHPPLFHLLSLSPTELPISGLPPPFAAVTPKWLLALGCLQCR